MDTTLGLFRGIIREELTAEPIQQLSISLYGNERFHSRTTQAGTFTFFLSEGQYVFDLVGAGLPEFEPELITVESQEILDREIFLPAGELFLHESELSFEIHQSMEQMHEIVFENQGNHPLNINFAVEYENLRANEVHSAEQLELSLRDDRLRTAIYIEPYYYVAGSNNVNNPNLIYRIDQNGDIVSGFGQPGSEQLYSNFDGALDLAWDGQLLWACYDSTLVAMDISTGRLARSLAVPYETTRGLTYDFNLDAFWIAGDNGVLTAYSRDDASQLQQVFCDFEVNGLCFQPH